MKNARYQIEVWKKGALVCRTEESDDVQRTKQSAQTMSDALGITFTVFVVRDGSQFASYEWDAL